MSEQPHGKRIDVRSDCWTIDVDDYGFADVKVRTGDLDGSGEAPGVQLEIEHTGRAIALAMSAREAELVARALLRGASLILPHMRLRATRRKWSHEVISQPPPTRDPVAETIEVTPEEADLLLALVKEHGGEELEGVLAQLEVPF
jgi:hypothetical protein